MSTPFVSLVSRGLSVAVRGRELPERRKQLLGSMLGAPEAVPWTSGVGSRVEDEHMSIPFTG
jgi:hypothetical protein